MESKGTLFPKNQPMKMYSSLWNAEDLSKLNEILTLTPFTASYLGYNEEACDVSNGKSSCPNGSEQGSSSGSWLSQELDSTRQERMRCRMRAA
ncbi:hypothetical protein HID58_012687 [Brassica napus]|uniref:Uncharacterized protein n=1 Tax=Brassica napus TaxID=3708 RepID=A0ABQ8E1T0_BRANA|nr:hypothetical protein HID58_012687 [Brassica napus]